MENEIALEETTPTEQTKQTDSQSDGDLDCAEDSANQVENNPQQADEIKIPVKYNKQQIELSVEQASELAQKGMKFDDMRSVMDKLAYLSAVTRKSTQKLVDALVESNENELAQRLREMAGDDEVLFSKLLTHEHNKHKTAFERAFMAQKEDEFAKINAENEQLADQFIELNKEFPEIDKVSDVPQQVFEIAAQKNISLLDGYLRYRHYEDAKLMTAQQDNNLAAQSSAGSQMSGVLRVNVLEDALLKGIWNRN